MGLGLKVKQLRKPMGGGQGMWGLVIPCHSTIILGSLYSGYINIITLW